MKKQFNKKKLITFGVLGLFAMILVTAVVVNYLSNPVIVDVEIESPIEQWISESENGDWLGTHLDFQGHTGGENLFIFYVKTENVVADPVTGYTENIVTSPKVWDTELNILKYMSCDDFDSVEVTTTSTFTPGNPPSDVRVQELENDEFCSRVDYQSDLVWTCGPYDLITYLRGVLCINDVSEDNIVEFSYGPTPIIWEPGQVDITKVNITFADGVLGNYRFTSQIVISPTV
jgi:hypothetical protein